MMKNRLLSLINDDNDKSILKRATFWNMIASILNSLMSAFLLYFVTRINGITTAGIFSYASAVSYQCLSLGAYGVRNFQASDVKNEYSFSDYLNHRIFSAILMYSLLIYSAFCKGYTFEKAMIVFTFGIFKSIDAIEDVFHGEYHRNGRLDVAAFIQSIRYSASLASFVGVLLLTKDLILTCLFTSFVTIAIFLIQNKAVMQYFVCEKYHVKFVKIKNLLLLTTPICISNLINMYVVNAPKYAIDHHLNSDFQAYFGYLLTPVFTINLLSTVIYRPYINKLSIEWQKKNMKLFNRHILIQLGIIFALTASITLFGYLIGLRLLEMIYGVKLLNYMNCFVLLLLGGGLNTIASFLSIILTIQRKQNTILIGYFTSFVFCLLASDFFVFNYELLGASLLYVLSSLTLTVVFSMFAVIFNKRDSM